MKFFAFLILSALSLNSFGISASRKNIKLLPSSLQAQATEILNGYQAYQKTKTKDSTVYLDLDEGNYTSVFSKPGMDTPGDCEADASKHKGDPDNMCESVGWPDNKSAIHPTGKLEFVVVQDQDGKDMLQAYTEVTYVYSRDGKELGGKGWISEDIISFKPVNPSYAPIVVSRTEAAMDWAKAKANKICDTVKEVFSSVASSRNQNDLADLANHIGKDIETKNLQRKTVTDTASSISSVVGQCMLKPPNKPPSAFSKEIPYDEFALPAIKNASLPTGVLKENKKPMTRQDLIDIDALARTIYGEMASCTPIGAQYPMAVARVIRNRETAMIENQNYIKEFVKNNGAHDSDKSLLSRAATSPVLFSTWNKDVIDFNALESARSKKISELRSQRVPANEAMKNANRLIRANPDTKDFYKPNNSGLLHTLCPPSDPNGICYTGGKPDRNLTAAWQNIVKVATEAVLYPNQFAEKTAQLKGIKHYTSNRGAFYDFVEVQPSIEGRKISSARCLNLWRPMTPAEREAKEKAAQKKSGKRRQNG